MQFENNAMETTEETNDVALRKKLEGFKTNMQGFKTNMQLFKINI